MTDPIADILTRIRNAQIAGKNSVRMPSSKFKLSLVKILKREGYISDVVQYKRGAEIILEVVFKKNNDNYAISEIRRVSSPGRRVYIKSKNIKNVLNGYGIAIISTSEGIMTNVEAKRKGLGGEIICEVW